MEGQVYYKMKLVSNGLIRHFCPA